MKKLTPEEMKQILEDAYNELSGIDQNDMTRLELNLFHKLKKPLKKERTRPSTWTIEETHNS